jgi:glycerol kinase
MREESGIKPVMLYADGGMTRSQFAMRFQAGMLGFPVVTTGIEDLSLMGSVYLAGLAVGIWDDTKEIKALRRGDSTFLPEMAEDTRKKNYKGWKKAVENVLTV